MTVAPTPRPMPELPADRLALTEHELAERLGLSYATVRRERIRGAIRAVRVGRAIRVPVDEVARLLREGTEPRPAVR